MLFLALGLGVAGCGGGGSGTRNPTTEVPTTVPELEPTAFPLEVSTNGRYLVGQDGIPFFIHGESPQALIVNISEADADFFLGNRAGNGFNAVWINLLSETKTGGRPDGSTFDGLLPFTVPGDLATPNEAYFRRADAMIRLAAKHKQLVFLNPIETDGWLGVLRTNGVEKARNYGRFVGTRYGVFDNIIWLHGNNFQTWENPDDSAVVRAVAEGILQVDGRHLHTSELNFFSSGSLDDESWSGIIGLNGSFTYFPTYDQVLRDYNRANFVPTFLIESNYEWEGEGNLSPQVLRKQAYWALLSGACGHLWSNRYTWRFLDNWKNALNTTSATQMSHLKTLFSTRSWYNLVPDQTQSVVTSGHGTRSADSPVADNDLLTAAVAPDGTLAIAYVPTIRTFTVRMSNFAGPARVRWFDPTNGAFTNVAASSPNTGELALTPPGPNIEGSGDWVLVIETN